MNPVTDWQTSRYEIKARGQYLLETGKWADCYFLVGEETSQMKFACHKLILAMASPVFEAMFYGEMAEKNDPVVITDLEPDVFKRLLEYIYHDKISISTVTEASELCYAAKKYIIPHVVDKCTSLLSTMLSPKNACQVYEFALFFDDFLLTEKCLKLLREQTSEVIKEASFEEAEPSMIVKICSQKFLNINDELELFWAVHRYAEKQGLCTCGTVELVQATPTESTAPKVVALKPSAAVLGSSVDASNTGPFDASSAILFGAPGRVVFGGSTNQSFNAPPLPLPEPRIGPTPFIESFAVNKSAATDAPLTCKDESAKDTSKRLSTVREALRHIRFLTLTPQQFAEGPAKTCLLTESETLAILMNISTHSSCYPMPEGFTKSKLKRIDSSASLFTLPTGLELPNYSAFNNQKSLQNRSLFN